MFMRLEERALLRRAVSEKRIHDLTCFFHLRRICRAGRMRDSLADNSRSRGKVARRIGKVHRSAETFAHAVLALINFRHQRPRRRTQHERIPMAAITRHHQDRFPRASPGSPRCSPRRRQPDARARESRPDAPRTSASRAPRIRGSRHICVYIQIRRSLESWLELYGIADSSAYNFLGCRYSVSRFADVSERSANINFRGLAHQYFEQHAINRRVQLVAHFSVSSSTIGSPCLNASPSFLIQRTMVTFVVFIPPVLGTTRFVTMANSFLGHDVNDLKLSFKS